MSSATTAQPVLFRRDLLGKPDSTANTADSTLVIIDAQNEYASGALACSNVASSRDKIASLLSKYRSANGKIIHIKHKVPDGAPVFTPGTPLADEFAELTPRDGETVVWKQFPGSFAQTSLKEDLGDVKKVVLTGYMAHVCVSTTAREAHQLGYEVVLPRDAIGDRDIPGATGEEVTKVCFCSAILRILSPRFVGE
jgi:nicotinamidase-related amidase